MWLRAWRDAATPGLRTRLEETILAAMTADRTAAAFAHRIEWSGCATEFRAPTLDELAATVKRLSPHPTAWGPSQGEPVVEMVPDAPAVVEAARG